MTMDDDRYDEFKDAVACGYLNPDGSQREPDPEPHLERQAQEQHEDEAHGGGTCDCPPFDMGMFLVEMDREHRAEVHGGATCDCPPGEPPF